MDAERERIANMGFAHVSGMLQTDVLRECLKEGVAGVKIWIALPEKIRLLHLGLPSIVAAMCPPVTREMEQDNMRWFDAEVKR